ncbi:unnamed protein product [Orchesella dallaii]|uniref:EB domain-containing protein n=1 Tax=Orchesella dallaii TaxID=48710 RepID=A0ABP1RFH3_9HEXA
MNLSTPLFVAFWIILSACATSCENDFSNENQSSTETLKNPYIQSKLGGQCSKFNIKSCNVLGAYCIKGICSCTYSRVADTSRNKCILKANRLGDSCKADIQCSAAFSSNSKCGPDNTCICDESSVPNDDDTECLQGEKFPEEECFSSTNCVGYPDKAECLNGLCKCRNGFLPALNSSVNGTAGCLPLVPNLGGKCVESQQCQLLGNLSTCRTSPFFTSKQSPYKVCLCTEDGVSAFASADLYLESDTCYKRAKRIGDPCNITQQCTANLGIFTKCSADNKKCVCSYNSLPSKNGKTCLRPQVLIGDSCQLSAQCVGKPDITSVCTTNEICLCAEGFVPNANFSDCLPIVERLGEPCRVSWQCNTGQDSECAEYSWEKGSGEKVCKCKDGYSQEPGLNVCRPKVRNFDSFCETHAQCIVSLKKSLCINGQCQCVGETEAVPLRLNHSQLSQGEFQCVTTKSELIDGVRGKRKVIREMTVAL